MLVAMRRMWGAARRQNCFVNFHEFSGGKFSFEYSTSYRAGGRSFRFQFIKRKCAGFERGNVRRERVQLQCARQQQSRQQSTQVTPSDFHVRCGSFPPARILPSNYFAPGKFQPKELFRVRETNIAHHFADKSFVFRNFAGFDVMPQKITEHAAEIFMTREGHERTRIRKHADETRKQTRVGKRVQLPLDRLLLIEKPPTAAELHFSCDASILKISNRSREKIIVGRIQIVDHHFRQRMFLLEKIHIFAKGSRPIPVANGIETCVGAEFLQTASVGAAQRSKMELLSPAAFRIQVAEINHEK